MDLQNFKEVAQQRKQENTVIAVVAIAHSLSHFFHLILAPIFPWIKEAFQLSYGELGFLMTMFFVVSGVGQALAGFVVDRIGARAVLFFGVACLGVSALVLASAQQYAVLLAGTMLAGLGNSVFHPADYTILNNKISGQRIAQAFSAHGLSGNLGWACAPAFLVTITHWSDWRTALIGAASLACLILALLFLFRRELKVEPTSHVETKGGESQFAFMRLPAIWLCFGFFLISAMGVSGVQNFSPSALNQLYGVSISWALSAYTAFMLASACGIVLGGQLAKKNANHALIIGVAFSISALSALLLASVWVNAYAVFGLMMTMGFCAGIAGPSRDLLIRASAPKSATGRVYGIVYSGLDTGLACAPLLFAAVMDAKHPALVFIVIAGLQILAIVTAANVGAKRRVAGLAVA